MVGRRVSPAAPTINDAQSYLAAVKETFHDEPSKYAEFLKLLNGIRNQKVDKDVMVARVEELMEDHDDLLHGFNVFLPDEAKRIKNPHTNKIHADAEEFMNKLKTRFKTLDTEVVGSFRQIMEMFKEGKLSVKQAQEEVIDVLYYHEDLIEDFLTIFEKKKDRVALALLQL
ncbi:hypothetical protein CARUB_v10010939mg [Capsella rubella]|uniref:Uncharacterized protein n=1 Tax=Capsella rubella TaxID=81985 RepID=R0GSJ4_9BRAS|nr:paired amphipathic helix protein Sin3-like 3 [Capsella rubella]EOA38756.1 hypothetical protein CARUB_v10010939mg [Capsella rubella]